MSKGTAAGAKGGKKNGAVFVINYAKPVEDKIMDIASLEKFLQERIKVGGNDNDDPSQLLADAEHKIPKKAPAPVTAKP